MLSGCGDLRKSIFFKCPLTYFQLFFGKKIWHYKLPLIFHLKWVEFCFTQKPGKLSQRSENDPYLIVNEMSEV